MTYFDSLNFVYRLVLARFDFTVWVWATLAFGLSFLVLYWLWGLSWNNQWQIFKHPGIAVFNIAVGLIVAGATITWLAADRSVTWLELQRTELGRQFTDSGARNRRIFVEIREHLGRTSIPDDNSLELRNERELSTVAEVAAADVHCPLTVSGPLGYGAPCHVREPLSVAQEVLRTVPSPSFPITVSPDNPWIRAAVTAQLEEAFSYATPRLRKAMTELKDATRTVFWFALSLQALIVPFAAVGDIRDNPSV